MSKTLIYIAIFILGAVVSRASVDSTTLYGGTFTSSPLANIYGYASDYEGCRQISACLNYAQHKRMLTSEFSSEWSNVGNHYCK